MDFLKSKFDFLKSKLVLFESKFVVFESTFDRFESKFDHFESKVVMFESKFGLLSQKFVSGLIESGFCTIWFVYVRHIHWSCMFSSLIFNVFLSHLLVNGVESILNLEYVTYVRVHALDRKSWPWPNSNSDLRNAKIDVGHVSTAYLLFAKYSFDLLSRGRSSAGDYLFDELTDMDKHKIEWP